MLKRTSLYDAHIQSKAKMTPFSGWEMPLHYGSQVMEHEAVRCDAGMFDVSHMCMAHLFGRDAKKALLTLLANDIRKLKPHQAFYTTMLNESGGIIDDLIVYQESTDVLTHHEHYYLIHNAGRTEDDINWIQAKIAQYAWEVDYRPHRDLSIIAIQGPTARKKAASIRYTAAISEAILQLSHFQMMKKDQALFARTGYTGEDGFEWVLPSTDAPIVWQQLLSAGVKPCGLGSRDTLRLEAGLSLYGQDLDENHTPKESGIGWTVSIKDDRSFIGKKALQETLPRMQTLGLKLPSGGILRPHQAIRHHHGTGEVVSGGFSPTLKMSIALARLPIEVVPGDKVEVNIRNQWLSALVVKPPFVRYGKPIDSF